MPNHITSRLNISGSNDQVKRVIEKFSTVHERVKKLTHDNHVVCKEISGDFIGWYDKENDSFQYSKDRGTDKRSKGMPENVEFEYREEFVQMPDFDKVIPTPEILKNTEFHTGIITRAQNAMGIEIDKNELISRLEASNRIRDCFTPIKESDIENVIKAIQAFKETGFFYWYDWNIENWGTKWNSYSCEKVDENTFTFQTAWSGVVDIIEKISSEFPEVEFWYSYADEDTGSNTGVGKIQNGVSEMKYPENSSIEAYELAFSINPDNKEYYKLVDGTYEYVDEDED